MVVLFLGGDGEGDEFIGVVIVLLFIYCCVVKMQNFMLKQILLCWLF